MRKHHSEEFRQQFTRRVILSDDPLTKIAKEIGHTYANAYRMTLTTWFQRIKEQIEKEIK